MCNKWWDGYMDHEVVLIEDFDNVHDKLGHHMKIWSDRFKFTAEVKESSMATPPKLVIVTSHCHPKDIWTDETTIEPALRRFKCVEFKRLNVFTFSQKSPAPMSSNTLLQFDD
eukprot:6212938-Pleurochrysis_carterae.AAC.19